MSRPQLSGYLKAIHYGHGNIEYGQFRLMRLNGSEGRFTIYGLCDDPVRWLQQTSQHLHDSRLSSAITTVGCPLCDDSFTRKFPYLIKKFRWMDRFQE